MSGPASAKDWQRTTHSQALPFIERRRIDPLKLGHRDIRTDEVAATSIEGFFPCSIIGIFAVRVRVASLLDRVRKRLPR
jgi:hypothetical protein